MHTPQNSFGLSSKGRRVLFLFSFSSSLVPGVLSLGVVVRVNKMDQIVYKGLHTESDCLPITEMNVGVVVGSAQPSVTTIVMKVAKKEISL